MMNMKKLFLFLIVLVAVCSGASAQQTRTITGVVLYAGDNEPLIGAAILPANGGQGTVTDVDGRFSLAAAFGTGNQAGNYFFTENIWLFGGTR